MRHSFVLVARRHELRLFPPDAHKNSSNVSGRKLYCATLPTGKDVSNPILDPLAATNQVGACSAKYFSEVTALAHSPISSKISKSLLELKIFPVNSSRLVIMSFGLSESAKASAIVGDAKKSILSTCSKVCPSSLSDY